VCAHTPTTRREYNILRRTYYPGELRRRRRRPRYV